MATAALPHNKWVVNRHFTSRCDFCDKKNTVLQHCDAPQCHINICKPCMNAGILAEDKDHLVGKEQVARFEWNRRILPRQGGGGGGGSTANSSVGGPQQQMKKAVPRPTKKQLGKAPKTHEAVLPAPQSAQLLPLPAFHRPAPLDGNAIGLPTIPGLPSLPLALPSRTMYLGQTYPAVPLPSFETFLKWSNVPEGLSGPIQPPPKEPKKEPKTSPTLTRTLTPTPTPTRNPPKRKVKSPTQEPKSKKRRGEVVKETTPTEQPRRFIIKLKIPERLRRKQESPEVIQAANILMAMSQGGYATEPLTATPQPQSKGAAAPAGATPGGPMTPVDSKDNACFLPSPGPSNAGPTPSSKATQVTDKICPTRDEDVPWNPMHGHMAIRQAQWNEKDSRGDALSRRAQALRATWDRIMTYVMHQFGLDDDEDLYTSATGQFRLAWERMAACVSDMSDENRMNRTIGVAVTAEVERMLQEGLAAWGQ